MSHPSPTASVMSSEARIHPTRMKRREVMPFVTLVNLCGSMGREVLEYAITQQLAVELCDTVDLAPINDREMRAMRTPWNYSS